MDEIFDMWPTAADLARDIGENEVTVRHWKRRRSIPAHFDVSIVRAAESRGFTLTFDRIAKLRAAIAFEKRIENVSGAAQ